MNARATNNALLSGKPTNTPWKSTATPLNPNTVRQCAAGANARNSGKSQNWQTARTDAPATTPSATMRSLCAGVYSGAYSTGGVTDSQGSSPMASPFELRCEGSGALPVLVRSEGTVPGGAAHVLDFVAAPGVNVIAFETYPPWPPAAVLAGLRIELPAAAALCRTLVLRDVRLHG